MRAPGLTVLSAALALLTCLHAEAHGAVVEKSKQVGKQAATSFSGTATITCPDGSTGSVSAFGFLSGSEQINKQTGTPKTETNGVFVEVDFYSNDCTNTFLSGFGGITDGFTPPNKRLNSAGLEGTAFVQDFGSGVQIAVAIDVVIEGTGPLTASKSTTKTKTLHPVTITINKSANANRAGVASGTIAIDGVALDTTYSNTTLSDNATLDITIEKK